MASNIMGKFKNILKQQEEEYDDYYEEEIDEEETDEEQGTDEESVEETEEDTQSNVFNIHDTPKVQFKLFRPEAFDKIITDMADELIKRNTVILNVEQTNKDVSRRIIDFLSGVAYAHSGRVSKVAEETYIIMPSNVELSGEDIMDEVGSDNVYF